MAQHNASAKRRPARPAPDPAGDEDELELVQTRIPPEAMAQLRRLAKDQERSVASVLRRMILEQLKQLADKENA